MLQIFANSINFSVFEKIAKFPFKFLKNCYFFIDFLPIFWKRLRGPCALPDEPPYKPTFGAPCSPRNNHAGADDNLLKMALFFTSIIYSRVIMWGDQPLVSEGCNEILLMGQPWNFGYLFKNLHKIIINLRNYSETSRKFKFFGIC